MISLPNTLPDDPEQLKALLIALELQAKRKENAFESEIRKLTSQLHDAFEALRLERVRRFASKSEKAPGQGELFDEADNDITNTDVIEAAAPNTSKQPTQKKASSRKSLKRKHRVASHCRLIFQEVKRCMSLAPKSESALAAVP